MKKIILIFSFSLFYSIASIAQQTVIKADTIIHTPGDSVIVSLNADEFNNIGSFTLYLEFNNSALIWGQALNWNPLLIAGTPLVNAVGNTIIIAWADANGVSINNDNLCDLQFYFTGGESDLSFTASCEVTDLIGNPISPDPIYHDGRVAEPLQAVIQASQTIICSGETVQLEAIALYGSGSYAYSWSSNPSGFSSTSVNPTVNPTSTTQYLLTISDGINTDTSSVVISMYPLPSPVFTSSATIPSDSTENLFKPITFSWPPANYADRYDFYLWVDSLPRPSTPFKSDITQIFFTYSGPMEYGTKYKWQIVAKNSCHYTESPVYHFTSLFLSELHVSQVSASQAYAGQPLTVSWTVTNDGEGATTAPLWYDRIWLCLDVEVRVGEPDDIMLGQFDNLTYLPPGQSYTNTKQVILPNGIEGTFFLFVLTDSPDAFAMQWGPAGGTAPIPYTPDISGNPYPYIFAACHGSSNHVLEASDYAHWNDNFFYKQIDVIMPPEPDLIVTSIIPPSNVFSGQNGNITWSVKNNGSVTGSGSWTDAVYLSRDSIVPDITQATLLGTFNFTGYLQPDSIYTKTEAVTFPSFEFGDYYIHILTDASDQLYEGLFEDNNKKVSSQMTIFLTPPPDLKCTVLNNPDTADNKMEISVEWEVKNQGATPTDAGSWYDNIFISEDSSFDSISATSCGKIKHIGNLDPDSSYTAQAIVQVPEGITGHSYVYVYADVDNNVFEHNQEANNIARSDTTLLIQSPDLFISYIENPTEESTNQPVNIGFSIRNNGPGDLLLSNFTNKVYLSKYEAFDPDSVVEIGALNSVTSILSGDSLMVNRSFSIPVNLNGTYYLFIEVDAANSVYEAQNENNNISRSLTTINITRADLEVSNILFNPQTQSGSLFAIAWQVTNNGPGTILNSRWTDMLMISKAPNYQPDSVIVLGVAEIDTTVIAGGGYEKLQWFNMPELESGNYFIYVYTDVYDSVFENFIEANNIIRSITPVEITNPDLIVSKIEKPLSASSGNNIDISWTDKNVGNGDLKYDLWQDLVMLSPLPVYYADSIIEIGTYANVNTISANDSLIVNRNVTIPNGISGNYYFFIHTDINDSIYEGGLDNNNLLIDLYPISISLSPWIDLSVKNITLPDSSVSGKSINIQYTVKNEGYQGTGNLLWNDKIYLSTQNILDTNAILLHELSRNIDLLPDSSYHQDLLIKLPANLIGTDYYVIVHTDADSALYEYVYDNNNILISSPMHIDQYPIDLAAQYLNAPDTAWSGERIYCDWEVKNVSDVPTLSTSWYDALYLSSDPVFDPGDILVDQWQIFGPLESDSSYTKSKAVIIPNGSSGLYFLLLVSDHTNINFDVDLNNNITWKTKNNLAYPIFINLTPSADLIVEQFTAPLECTSGQPFDIMFTVKNIGDGSTICGSWTDKIYMSTDFIIDNKDEIIGTYQRTTDLDTNASYSDTISVTIPVWASGNYILIYNTDSKNQVYEHQADSNNTSMAFILAIQPPPTDLIVKDIIIADSGIVGKTMNIQYTLKNIGQNPAKGHMRDIVYLSKDTLVDIDDAILKQKQHYINLIPLAEQNLNISADIPGVELGEYFVIVNTDVKNNIYESNNTNNSSFSDDNIYIDVNLLPFDVLTHDTLFNSRDLNYRVEVHDTIKGETMLTTMKADSINGVNEMYVNYNKTASRIDYDYSHEFPYQGNQELIVPSLETGNYYMLLFGNTLAGNSQEISLKAIILNFEIRNVNPSTGSNRDYITLEISGSKFVPLLHVWLQNANDTIQPDTIIYVNRSKVFVTFDLLGASLGYYDVMAHNFCEGITSLEDGFEIISGDAGRLGIDIVTPTTARPYRVTSFTVEFANIGFTDINNPTISIISHTGAPIALTSEELSLGLTQLSVPLQVDGEPPGILRPGVSGTVVIYTYTSAGIGITIGSPNF